MESAKKPFFTHRRTNNALSILVVILALYILLLPLLPKIGFWLNNLFNKNVSYLVAANTGAHSQTNDEEVPKNNVLVIPSIKLQQDIVDGPDSGTLSEGVWHRPNSGTPDSDGNTVIVGHRFTYANPSGEFYHLDKVKQGDKIVVYWNQKKTVYQVDQVSVVSAQEISIEQQTSSPVLTLYTCTPLWSAKDRLVVRAKPVGETP